MTIPADDPDRGKLELARHIIGDIAAALDDGLYGGRDMREAPTNKAMQAYTCPTCGRVDPHCRDTRNGPYCRQWGLRYDLARLQQPSPDPIDAKVKADPEANAAALAEAEAQTAFDEATGKWTTALSRLAAVRIKSASDEGSWGGPTGDGGWRPNIGKQRKLRAEESRLVGEVELLAERREQLGRELVRARTACRVVLDDARLRAGGAVLWRPTLAGEGSIVIPRI